MKMMIEGPSSIPVGGSTFNRRHIWNLVEHLHHKLFCRNSQCVKAVGYFRRKAPSCIFDRLFDRILNGTLPNNL